MSTVKKLEAQYAIPILKKYSLPFIDMILLSKKEELQKVIKKIKYPAVLSLHQTEASTSDTNKKRDVADSFPLSSAQDALPAFESLKGVIKKKYPQMRTPLFLLRSNPFGEEVHISLQSHEIFGPVLSFAMQEKNISTFLPLQEDFFQTFFTTFGFEKQKTQMIGFLSRLSKLSEDKNIHSYTLTCVVTSAVFVKEVSFEV